MNVVQVTANKQDSREEITSRSRNRQQDKQYSYSEDIPLLKWLGVNVGIMQSIAHTIFGELRNKFQPAEFWGLFFD